MRDKNVGFRGCGHLVVGFSLVFRLDGLFDKILMPLPKHTYYLPPQLTAVRYITKTVAVGDSV